MKNVGFYIVFWALIFEFWRGCVFFFWGGEREREGGGGGVLMVERRELSIFGSVFGVGWRDGVGSWLFWFMK